MNSIVECSQALECLHTIQYIATDLSHVETLVRTSCIRAHIRVDSYCRSRSHCRRVFSGLRLCFTIDKTGRFVASSASCNNLFVPSSFEYAHVRDIIVLAWFVWCGVRMCLHGSRWVCVCVCMRMLCRQKITETTMTECCVLIPLICEHATEAPMFFFYFLWSGDLFIWNIEHVDTRIFSYSEHRLNIYNLSVCGWAATEHGNFAV